MKKISALILILLLLFSMFGLTSCELESWSNFQESVARFALGDSEAADFLMKYRSLLVTDDAIANCKKTFQSIGRGFEWVENSITEAIADAKEAPIQFTFTLIFRILGWIGKIILVLFYCGFAVGHCLVYIIYALVCDYILNFVFSVAMFVLAILRGAAYILVDWSGGVILYRLKGIYETVKDLIGWII